MQAIVTFVFWFDGFLNCCPTSSIRTEIATQEPPNGDAEPLLTGFALEQRDDTTALGHVSGPFPGIQQLEVRRRNLARKSVQRDEEALLGRDWEEC